MSEVNIDLIQQLEKAGLDGLPALITDTEDGWLLRRSEGYSRRANCVMPLGPCRLPLTAKITAAEGLYSAEDLPCIFKLTQASEPAGLDAELERRGYSRDAETLVLTRDLAQAPAMPDGVNLSSEPDAAWLDTWRSLSPRTEQFGILRRLLQAIITPAAFARIDPAVQEIGSARAVVSDDWVGLFDLAVHSDHRRCGYGRALADARLAWGHAQGARRAYLQVMADNGTAQRLQARLGFTETYRYWYRIQPEMKAESRH